MFRHKNIFFLVGICGFKRGKRGARFEGFGEGVDCVEEIGGKTLDCVGLGGGDFSSGLGLEVSEFCY